MFYRKSSQYISTSTFAQCDTIFNAEKDIIKIFFIGILLDAFHQSLSALLYTRLAFHGLLQ